MANKLYPQGCGAGETLRNNDIIGVYKPDDTPDPADGSLNKSKTIEEFRQEINNEGVYLKSDKIESKEISFNTISTVGWYTIAELGAVGGNSGSASFKIRTGNSLQTVKTGIRTRNVARTIENTTLKIMERSINLSLDIESFRLAKSDDTNSTGAKLQMYINTSVAGDIQITENIGLSSGWELVNPYLDDTPVLPDGLTNATFITEYEVSGTNRILWTGPLSATGITTSLNSGEDFDNWDSIKIFCNLVSNTSNGRLTEQDIPLSIFPDNRTIEFYSDSGKITIERLTSTTFRMLEKTVANGNCYYIIGVKL